MSAAGQVRFEAGNAVDQHPVSDIHAEQHDLKKSEELLTPVVPDDIP